MLLDQISSELFLPRRELDTLVQTAPRRYKVYTILKRTGGRRTIAHPARELKRVQRWLTSKFLSQLPVHSNAMAYVSGKSILHNAQPHATAKFLLKMDFSNFFPSIAPEDLLDRLTEYNLGLGLKDREILARLTFWQPKDSESLQLSIGAPSSPQISNAVMHRFDTHLSRLVSDLGIVYTRYADDLCFSTSEPDILSNVPALIKDVVATRQCPRLVINEKKTVFASKKTRRRVTGLILTNAGQVSLGRFRKRLIRAMLHHHLSKQITSENLLVLRGYLALANSVDPSYFNALCDTYGDSVIGDILHLPTKQSLAKTA